MYFPVLANSDLGSITWKTPNLICLREDRLGLRSQGALPSHYRGVFQILIASCLDYFISLLSGLLSLVSATFILSTTDNVLFPHHSLTKGSLCHSAMASPFSVVSTLQCTVHNLHRVIQLPPYLLCTLLLTHPSVPSCHLQATQRTALRRHLPRPPYICSCFFLFSV